MNVRRMTLGATMAGVLLAAAACGNSAGDGGDGGGGDEAYDIGIVQFSATDETAEKAINSYVEYADDEGWNITKVDPQGSLDKAISAVNDFVQKGVDLIIVTVFPTDQITGGVRAATEAGIPIISFSGGSGEGVPLNADSGALVSTDLSKQLVDDMGGEGELLLLGYKSGLPCIGREEALNDALEGSDITVTRQEVAIPGQVESGTKFTQAWLAKNREGSGNLAIWACFDDPALGAVSALRSADRTDVKVYGINGTPAAVTAVQSGAMRATAFIDVAGAGRELAVQTPDVIEGGVDAEPKDIPIPTFVVTKESYDEFAQKYPDEVK